MPFWVVNMKLCGEYKIYLEFNDGCKGIIDFYHKLTTDHRNIIRELIDKEKFSAIKIERHTLCWDNGVDFAPEYLYERIKTERESIKGGLC